MTTKPETPFVPPEEVNLNPYSQDQLRVIARRCLEIMWLSGKAEILKELADELCRLAAGDHW